MRHAEAAEVRGWEEEAEVGKPAEGGGPGGALPQTPLHTQPFNAHTPTSS